MKRFMFYISFALVAMSGLWSCTKTLENDYLNPELTTEGSIGKLFTGMLFNNRIHSSYWDYFTFNFTATGAFTQMHATTPSDQMYIPSPDYMSSRWKDFYAGSMTNNTPDYNYSGPGILGNYAEMLRTYSTLSATDQKNNDIFLQVGKVIVCDQAGQMVDLWGDIPYSKSNSLNTDRDISYAPFDKAAAVYDSLIDALATINTYFDTVVLNPVAKADFAKQDLIYAGNTDSWRRYANSLRIRLLMRISYVDEAKAKTQITEMLGNQAKYPLLDDNKYNAQLNMSPTNLISDVQGAIGLAPYAPAYLLDTVMLANKDPRMPLFWSKTVNKDFKGFPSTGTAAQYTAAAKARTISTFDSATFIYNYNIPGVLFNASETDFLKAEAYQRWGNGDASAAYYAGIENSIAFYYGVHLSRVSKSLIWDNIAKPSDANIKAYEAMSAVQFAGTADQKLQKIWTQKWEHFFILQASQAWAELRRTGYPKLPFYKTSFTDGQLPPERLLYPSSEAQYNATNYAAVAAQDKRSVKIFWDVKN